MNEKKLVIHPLKYTAETTVISFRLPKDMLSAIDKVASVTGRTRNDIITTMLDFAIDNMEIKE